MVSIERRIAEAPPTGFPWEPWELASSWFTVTRTNVSSVAHVVYALTDSTAVTIRVPQDHVRDPVVVQAVQLAARKLRQDSWWPSPEALSRSFPIEENQHLRFGALHVVRSDVYGVPIAAAGAPESDWLAAMFLGWECEVPRVAGRDDLFFVMARGAFDSIRLDRDPSPFIEWRMAFNGLRTSGKSRWHRVTWPSLDSGFRFGADLGQSHSVAGRGKGEVRNWCGDVCHVDRAESEWRAAGLVVEAEEFLPRLWRHLTDPIAIRECPVPPQMSHREP